MLLLITGASGVGKSMIRALLALRLADRLDAVELRDVVEVPAYPDVRWRQQAVEQAVHRALELQDGGRHLLLCGDPIAPGELLAAPSADRLTGIAICLLDADRNTLADRLTQRGDPPEFLPFHLDWADWLRTHLIDPQARVEAITNGAWEAMRWDRWIEWRPGGWKFSTIDTSGRSPNDVAELASIWIEDALAGRAPSFDVHWRMRSSN